MAILKVPGTYPSIQNAIDSATAGDSIRIAAGYAGDPGAIVTVNDLVFSAPSTVINIVLNVMAGVTKVSLAGDAPIQIVGNSEDNEFVGNAGANTFFSGGGNDVLDGGKGNDTFVLNGGGGTVDGGRDNDTVQSNDLGTYSLTHVETLDVNSLGSVYASAAQLASFATITDSASAADTTITLRLTGAGGKVNLLPAVAGAHAVEVFANDVTGGVTVIATARNDTLLGSAFDDILSGGNGNDLIIVSGGTDVLNGDAGNDTFRIEYGGSGSVKGGSGIDTVKSNDLGTYGLGGVEILDTNGFNLIYATVAQLSSFDTITDSVAAADSQIGLLLVGAGGAINLQPRIAGAHSVNVVDAGLTGAVTVNGSDSDDRMTASTNLNTLRGKGGDDTFVVDYGGSGAVNGGDGIDTVLSNNLGTFSLSQVEILDTHSFNAVYATVAQLSAFGTITDSEVAADSRITIFLGGTGGSIDLSSRVAGAHSVFVVDNGLTGPAMVTGTDNDDFLVASANLNKLRGGSGDDTLQADYAGTGTLNGGDGTDTVQSNDLGSLNLAQVEILDTHNFSYIFATAAQLSAFGRVTDSEAAADSRIDVFLRDGAGEVDFSTRITDAHSVQVFAGSLTAGVKITGSANSDVLNGSVYADVLSGGAGNDTLSGDAGDDTFVFDQALVAGNVDTIVDFTPGGDRIFLSTSIFTAAGPVGVLNANAFFIGAGANDASDRIIYDSSSGALLYDADGTGVQAAQTFATLSPSLALAAGDFRLV